MIKNFKWLLLVSLTFMACDSNDDDTVTDVPVTSGSADFSKYVALGDSFAAGYSDNALFRAGQEGAYTNILAQQFMAAGGGDFAIPLMADNVGGFSSGGVQIPQFPTRLFFNGSAPVNVPGVSGEIYGTVLAGPFNNMGVPGAKSFHLAYPGYGTVNPYFGRFASSAGAKIIDDAVAQDPTFFSLWIGGNDVLSYATSGGVGVNQTGNFNPATYGSNDITDPNVFAGAFTGLVTALTANGAKGVVANLPYVNTLPYFTTVPYNPVPLDTATVGLLSSASGYGTYNGGIQFALANGLISAAEAAQRTITFHVGAGNAVVLTDSYLTNLTAYGIPSYRQATSADLIILPARTFIGTSVGGNPTLINGVSVPLADQWVLSKNEISEVKTATDAYNTTIESVATANGLAFVNAKAVMDQLATPAGVAFGSYTMSTTYVTGGTFSLDGVHPSPRGYALIANKFIEAINAKYGSTLRLVESQNYRILYPMAL
ncbi:SGNH/GDSL hydrolase family protein [Flavobacterium sp. GT3R68]|uniref:SGNH/GDSL hydrolase family protein n=1 Tax=Flavobacterium sp. GT3R68 TaxID=2594437 RepID=UPI000F88D890|nr:SGNH/GDSL hydrolase family protein [Flavobacterium sp. GT3R68]RTY90859.1 G-D-S-L family lipolytic protein [Flavobacterium sp. GSN2]TRW93852.1 G-D-S-L family lipolytic protein [Flavobacterium sp. GT3R68]